VHVMWVPANQGMTHPLFAEMEGSYKYNEKAVVDSRNWVVLQLRDWAGD